MEIRLTIQLKKIFQLIYKIKKIFLFKMEVETNEEDPWDEIGEDDVVESKEEIIKEKIDDNFIKEDTI